MWNLWNRESFGCVSDDLSRTVRPAASGTGKHRHFRQSTATRSTHTRRWVTSPTCSPKMSSGNCKASNAIGHTRYSTAGDSFEGNAQPIVVKCAYGTVALVPQRKSHQCRSRSARIWNGRARSFSRPVDSEVILHLLARSQTSDLLDALGETLGKVQGAFSLLMLTEDTSDRRPRSERFPSFVPRKLGKDGSRSLCARVGNLRIRSHRRNIPSRGRARRNRCDPRRRTAIGESAACSKTLEVHFRARLFFAAGQHRLRTHRSDKPRPAWAAFWRRRVRSMPTSSFRFPTPESPRRSAIRSRVRHSVRIRVDSKSLRRPHVHRTQNKIRHFGVKVKLNPVKELLAGKRVILIDDSHRPRHDEPQDRQDGPRGRRHRSAHADQLSADDIAVLLRNRYADEEGTDRIEPHGRRNRQIHRSRFARVPQPARLAARL